MARQQSGPFLKLVVQAYEFLAEEVPVK
ncbi:hypothetical protein CCACVL1_17821 [Corchorus capsularis]|uniref:Uncharacterized protein n=1 Tax=Corchorus capsularis TaxID=210143 RepID=A0A1R3HQ57_COCAP|nr:hypothetical protein CCACVL1_17821 [Corchorus capsularis]